MSDPTDSSALLLTCANVPAAGEGLPPVSDHLWDLMGPAMSSIVADHQRLVDLFDEVEYLLGIAYTAHGLGPGPVGRAALRTANSNRRPGSLTRHHAQALVAAGLFDSDEHLTQALQTYDADLHSSRHRF